MPKETKFIITKDDFYLDKSNEVLNDFQKRFQKNKFETLFEWGFKEKPQNVHPSALFIYQISEQFIKILSSMPELEIAREEIKVELSEENWQDIQQKIPYIIGNEHIDKEWVVRIFAHLNGIFADEIKKYKGNVSLYLAEKNQDLKVPERVFFHLVENKDELFPFAFLATYATRTPEGKISHMPLSYALVEFKKERDKLLALLSCLNKAAEVCTLLSNFIQTGELFHPLKLTSNEAYELLKNVEAIEACGILCRIPNWWRKKYASISVQIKIGDKQPSFLSFDSLLSTQPVLIVDGVELTKRDIKQLLQKSEGLAFLKGKWVEVNHEKLRKLLDDIATNNQDISLMDAMRIDLSKKNEGDNSVAVTNGEWLKSLLHTLKNPMELKTAKLPKGLKAELRPYQSIGYSWLQKMCQLGFGACLADDMGLGKTVQILTLLQEKYEKSPHSKNLLVVPASLLENWRKEAEKFTPKLKIHILHGRSNDKLNAEIEHLPFLTVTTYGMVTRLKGLTKIEWECLILDEAQAIKNPLTTQTKAVKQLKSTMRIALTGTPIENDLSNLWSLFDFLNKGLLGTSKEFKQFVKQLEASPEGYVKLKSMVSPFLLRRLKTDKTIISDLPDKVETVDYVTLSKQQVVLYKNLLNDMEEKILTTEGIEHRGIVLSTIMKLKQICNHPDQFLGLEGYGIKESGKFELLKELCETIYEKRERVIVFTQYKEIIPYLSDFLQTIFQQPGFVIHGGTAIKKRGAIVEQFNAVEYVPFIVCSLKAAGTGLNLTAANHVIHFDRWWNPSVENQATDRAFRIGQQKNVMVHKFVSQGTVEEKIDAMINSKKELAESVISSSSEAWITEMDSRELLNILRLDM